MIGYIVIWLATSPLPIGYNYYPCPKEYEINKIIAYADNNHLKAVSLMKNDLICIVKVDYEK